MGQEDATGYDIVGVLEGRSIPKEAIVPGFHAPYKRFFTGYTTV
ncbi:MAG: element excision factor XisI family protein [Saprospiraceae bacterium]